MSGRAIQSSKRTDFSARKHTGIVDSAASRQEREADARGGHVASVARLICWLTVTALFGACSLMYDADRKQCTNVQDCLLRFGDSMCVDGVCQAATGGPSSMHDAGSDAELGPAEAGSLGDGSQVAPSVEGGITPTPDASGAEGGPGPCVGAGCPECLVNADCERLGILGGVCADAICWAPTPECSVDADCIALGPEYEGGRCVTSQCRPNPRWRCEPPSTPPSPFGTKTLTVLLRDSLSLSPLPQITAAVCPKLDLQCAAPVTSATTDADGNLTFEVAPNFAGYLKVEAQRYMPAMYFLPPVLPEDGVLQPFPLLSAGLIIDALAFALGSDIDPRRGHMMLVAEDCLGAALPGVSFSSPQPDSSTVQFYVRDLLPSTSAMQTGDVGNGGYLNFPAGTAVISLQEVAAAIPLTTVSVVVRPGYITVAYIRPDTR